MKHEITCKVCGKKKIIYHNGLYCSRECYNYVHKLKRKICPVCQKEFQPINYKQIHCNIECYSKSEKLKDLSSKSKMILDCSKRKYHKGYKMSESTKKHLGEIAQSSMRKGINFEYNAKKFIERQPNVIEVIRAGASKGIDLTVIWKENDMFHITKEEVKSSLRWIKRRDKNPISLLEKDDKEKLLIELEKGFDIYLIYRELIGKVTRIKRIKLERENLQQINAGVA